MGIITLLVLIAILAVVFARKKKQKKQKEPESAPQDGRYTTASNLGEKSSTKLSCMSKQAQTYQEVAFVKPKHRFGLAKATS